VLPWMVHMSGAIYLGAAVILGVAFLGFAASAAWSRARCQARRLFLASIVYLPVLMALMVIDKL